MVTKSCSLSSSCGLSSILLFQSLNNNLEMNLRSNKDYATYMVADRISGGPFAKFLASRKRQEAMSLLNFWNDAQVTYHSCPENFHCIML